MSTCALRVFSTHKFLILVDIAGDLIIFANVIGVCPIFLYQLSCEYSAADELDFPPQSRVWRSGKRALSQMPVQFESALDRAMPKPPAQLPALLRANPSRQ
jgi:hypothetical protein